MKKVIAILLSFTLILSFTACGEKSKYTEDEAMDNIKYVEEKVEFLIDQMEFLEKNAGGKAVNGSVKIADSLVNNVEKAFNEINEMEFVKDCLPLTTKRLPEIEEAIGDVVTAIGILNRTNDGGNGLLVRQAATEAKEILEKIYDAEIYTFVYEG